MRELEQRVESIVSPADDFRDKYYKKGRGGKEKLAARWQQSVLVAREELAVLAARLETLNPVPA